jgi:HAE1 family hydrophobic/amphiphilic exporter-1
MKILASWYRRPITAATILIAVLSLSATAMLNLRLGPSKDQSASYSVIIRHFGIDGREMERSITRPLEDAISLIPDIDEMRSSSEYGKSRIDLLLSGRADTKEVYLLLQEAVDRTLRFLPASVQKPLIISGSMSRKPVFIVAFRSDRTGSTNLRDFIEHNIKPSYEKIDGTGEIEVAGGEIREIHVKVDAEKASALEIGLQDIAANLQAQSLILPAGKLPSFSKDLSVYTRGRIKTLESLRDLEIILPDGNTQRLGDIAEAGFGSRDRESISRVNGEKRVILYVQSSGIANMVSLSQSLRRETLRWEDEGFELDVVLDTGREIEESLFEVFKAISLGMLIVVFFLSLFLRNVRQIFLLSLTLPCIVLLTAALLSVLHISLDHFTLAGIAVGAGMIIDAGIILTENVKSREGLSSTIKETAKVIPPLVSSALTTLAVLIPLYFTGDFLPGIRHLALSLTCLISIALIVNILFLPPFLFHKKPQIQPRTQKRAVKKSIALLYRWLFFTMRRPYISFAGGILITTAMFIGILNMGKDLAGGFEGNSVFVHLECESWATVESVDEKCRLFTNLLNKTPGIHRIETIARRGSGDIIATFEPDKIDRKEVFKKIRELGLWIPGSFLYIPESPEFSERKIEVAVIGEDDRVLKKIAHHAAGALSEAPWVSQAVLHFKSSPAEWVFKIDHTRAAALGVSAGDIIGTLRWALYGPVALKWIEKGREMDLRIMADRDKAASIQALSGLPIQSGAGETRKLSQLGDFRMVEGTSRIYRKNRQRAVFFTVHSNEYRLDEMAQILQDTLTDISLPRGYAFEIDRQVIKLDKQFRFIWFTFALAVLLIYMILASQTESLTCPVVILSIVPTSLAFPITALWASGYSLTLPILVGMIVLSGLIVNNSILVIDATRRRMALTGSAGFNADLRMSIVFAIRKRLKPLLLTSGTTVLGTLPLLLIKSSGSQLLTPIAFVVFWGITGSLLSTIFLLPAVVKAFPRLLNR